MVQQLFINALAMRTPSSSKGGEVKASDDEGKHSSLYSNESLELLEDLMLL